MTLNTVTVVRSRRVRLFFSSALANAAFDPTLYAITSTNSVPSVVAVYAVGSNAAACELVLGDNLVDGVSYTLTVTNVPAVDLSTTTASFAFYHGSIQAPTNAEPVVSGADIFLFGSDIVWTGSDFAETADGDLATLDGRPNAEAALYRRLLGAPLPWNPNYSPNARQFVDGNDSAGLANLLRRDALRDDRVARVKITTSTDQSGNTVYTITPTFTDGELGNNVQVG